MNDRVYDLALQSIVKHIAAEQWVFTDEELKNYVESIVWECMEQVWYTREEMINETIGQNIKARMAKHFGFEQ